MSATTITNSPITRESALASQRLHAAADRMMLYGPRGLLCARTTRGSSTSWSLYRVRDVRGTVRANRRRIGTMETRSRDAVAAALAALEPFEGRGVL